LQAPRMASLTGAGLGWTLRPGDPCRLLEQLRGVVRARVAWGPDGPERVEVVADRSRSPEQVVRDVRSALAAAWGTDLPPERVRVVCTEALEDAPPCWLEAVAVARARQGLQVRVRVRAGDAVVEGEAGSAGPSPGEARLAAEAQPLAVKGSS